MHEEPCTDPYARFCGQTEAAASSDPMSGIEGSKASFIPDSAPLHPGLLEREEIGVKQGTLEDIDYAVFKPLFAR